MPVSPGSLVRGLYVVYLVIKERNLRDYNIAVSLGFFKYIGYLAFPIQMAYRYPALARFMASHWANETVHVVPVFGESGALMERWMFCLFYNWPLTIRRRISKRLELRASQPSRYWHIGLTALVAAMAFGIADWLFLKQSGSLPGLAQIWWFTLPLPLACGGIITMACGGAVIWKRLIAALLGGIVLALLYTGLSVYLIHYHDLSKSLIVTACMWRLFVFPMFTVIGAGITELKMPDSDLKQARV